MPETPAYNIQELPSPPAVLHFVGIGGVGMSGLARMLVRRGYVVTGSDIAYSPVVAALLREGLPVAVGHAATNLGDADLVIVTAAAPPDNPELVAARDRGIPIVKRAAVLGMLAASRTCIAVAGTHGKSTTSGMLAFALDKAGLAPSFSIGAEIPQLGTNARSGDGSLFVAEADEYDRSFLWLKPDVAIITNIEHDHPDVFPTLEDVEEAFDQFVMGIKPGGTLVLSADDPGCRTLLRRLESLPANVVTYGISDSADWQIERVAGRDHFRMPGNSVIRTRLRMPGLHNRANAAACLAAAAAVGVDTSELLLGLEQFEGVGRRFELKDVVGEITIVEDYAHHPTEIRATIVAARERFPAAKIIIVFQPHTYSRTLALLSDFASALSLADEVVLAPIYAARESDSLGVTSEAIAELIGNVPVSVGATLDDVTERAVAAAGPGDLILVAGAGDVWKVSLKASAVLRQRTETE
ncbi:MAG TPA: UDP-N-acetylmuramate--L-alanine ligase [Nitrolancea sp.]|nr:UDP-N-acetylmuramate--L-alanine ligase [Nitrolancea sp.]